MFDLPSCSKEFDLPHVANGFWLFGGVSGGLFIELFKQGKDITKFVISF